MINKIFLLVTRLLSLVMLPFLTSCGGGGGSGGGQTLHVAFSYAKDYAYLWQPNSISINAVGLDGASPICTVASGALPAGMAIEPNSCTISGTPTTAGTSSAVVQLTVGGFSGSVQTSVNLSVVGSNTYYTSFNTTNTVIATQPVSAVPLGPDNSPQNMNWQPQAGQTVVYSISSGSLPAGVTLNPTTGAISGAPAETGTFQFSVAATITSGSSSYTTPSQSNFLNVLTPAIGFTYPAVSNYRTGNAVSIAPIIETSSSLPSTNVMVTNYHLSATSDPLPASLNLDQTTGVISGTLTVTEPVGGTAYNIIVVGNVALASYSFLGQAYVNLNVSP